MMISVFPPNETAFADNGLKILNPLKAVIHKEDNGEYYLKLHDNLNNRKYYQSGNIIRVKTPWGNQCFRIKNPKIINKKVETKAYHLFFDTDNLIIADSYVVERNCNDALDHLNSATDIPSPFTVISDVPTVRNYRCVRKSLKEAISEVINRWGGHLVRNNRNIEVRQNIGQDRGAVLAYGKNIVNIKSSESWDKVVTKLMPVGKDGTLLPELWLEYSGNAPLYNTPYTKVITFPQGEIKPESFKDGKGDIDNVAYKTALVNDLRRKGINHLNANFAPKVNYELEAYIENVSDVGDTIWVKHPKCRINFNQGRNAKTWVKLKRKRKMRNL